MLIGSHDEQPGSAFVVMRGMAECIHGIPDNAAIQIGARNLRLDLEDYMQADLYRGTYERQFLMTVRRLTAHGALVVDVGANIGYYTLLLADLVGTEGRVIAIDPQPTLADQLRRIAPPNVDVHTVAAGASKATRTLRVLPGHSMLATLRTHGVDGWESFEVPVMTLDELVGDAGIGFLKIDVEHLEGEMLAGGTRTLGHTENFLIEVSAQRERVATLLSAHDHHLFRMVQTRGALRWHWNLVATNSSEIAQLRGDQR